MVIVGCSPFYSVEQSSVERGYRWMGRGEYARALSTFQTTLRDYPDSGLATLGTADALAEARRYSEAVAKFTSALVLLKASGQLDSGNGHMGEQTIGKRTFSYQNQGLRFPHGVEAYLYFRRALSHEALAKMSALQRTEHMGAAKSDYTMAQKLAPAWKDPSARLACLEASMTSDCTN